MTPSARSFLRYGAPLLWLFLGGAAVHWYHVRGRPPAVREIRAEEVPLSARDGALYGETDRLPKAAVLWVVDGDTAEVLWGGSPRYVRYFGLNTPERGHPCYEEAAARNRALAGAAVRLAFDERREDKHGRLLAYVFAEDGRLIDAQLVAEGLAKAWRRDGAYRDPIVALEEEARAARRGCLWSGKTPPAKAKGAPRRRAAKRK